MIASIGWLNPWLLAGAAAAVAPILIHLIHRNLAPERPFPAIDLLLRTQRQLQIHLRWKHWLLMLLRALLLLALATAFARPYLTTRRLLASGATNQPPTAYVFVLDDTLSMRMKTGGQETLFAHSVKQAREALGDVRDFDQIALLSVSGAAAWEAPHLAQGPKGLSVRLDEAQAGHRHETVWPAISRAAGILAQSPLKAKTIVVFSDMAQTSWDQKAADEKGGQTAHSKAGRSEATGTNGSLSPFFVRVVDAHPKPKRTTNGPNRAVVRVRVEEARSLISLSVGTQQFGDGAERQVACRIEGAGIPKTERAVTVGPAEQTVSLTLAPSERAYWIAGQAALEPDALAEDDARFFAIRRQRPVKALIVDGDPRETLHLTESFYIARALSPSSGAASTVAASVITPSQLADAPLGDYDCLVLANVPVLSASVQQRIADAARGGCGLLVAFGSRTTPGWPAGPLGDLMPARAERIESRGETDEPVGLAAAADDHPITGVLAGQWRLSLSGVSVGSWQRMAVSADARVLLKLTNGQPAWVESGGAGPPVIVSAIPLDRDWADFCIHPTFVPLLQQTLRYLSQSLGGSRAPEVLVGETLRFTLPPEAKPDALFIQPPAGQRVAVTAVKGADAGQTISYSATDQPGLYTLTDGGGKTLAVGVVNVDPAESDTRVVSAEAIMKSVGDTKGGSQAGAATAISEGRRPIATELLWLCVALLAMESFYARK